jgi:hypothetical protein
MPIGGLTVTPRKRRLWILDLLDALLYDGAAARRWFFGCLGFVVALASMIFIGGVVAAFSWTGRQWAEKVITATISLVFAMVNPVGRRSKTEQEG